MPTAQTVRALVRLAQAHRKVDRLLVKSGEVIRDEIRRNFDQSTNAGEYVAVDVPGLSPGEIFQPLAAYTIMRREQEGYHDDTPLKATGQTYRDIGVIKRGRRRVEIGGRTARARKLLVKQLGSQVTGILSSETRSQIPPRNPVGYRRENIAQIQQLWRSEFVLGGSADKHTVRISTRI